MEFIYFIRIAFASLFSFEFLNSIKIFNIPLQFPWLVLATATFGIWMFWEKFFKKKLPFPGLMGGLFVSQLYSNSLGNILRFYSKFNWYDKFTHFIGGVTVGAAVFLTLRYLNKKRGWQLGIKFLIIFAIALSLFLCVIYEFFEYFIDAVLHYSVITGEYDTVRDLLFDLIGILIATLFLNFSLLKRFSINF